jgi:hypothetical protein
VFAPHPWYVRRVAPVHDDRAARPRTGRRAGGARFDRPSCRPAPPSPAPSPARSCRAAPRRTAWSGRGRPPGTRRCPPPSRRSAKARSSPSPSRSARRRPPPRRLGREATSDPASPHPSTTGYAGVTAPSFRTAPPIGAGAGVNAGERTYARLLAACRPPFLCRVLPDVRTTPVRARPRLWQARCASGLEGPQAPSHVRGPPRLPPKARRRTRGQP